MPCSKGMKDCARTCAHRRLVEEYRITRHNEEIQRERITLGHKTETLLEIARNGHLITFSDWLRGHAHLESDAA